MSTSPYESVTTPAIEQANRLMSVTQNPGFMDIVRIGQELVQEAVDACSHFAGWDPQQIVILKVRQQTAVEYHSTLLARIRQKIEAGVEESRQSDFEKKTPAEVLEHGDTVRQQVLTKFDEMDLRVPGSY